MVDQVRVAPARRSRARRIVVARHARIEQQVVDGVLPQLLQGLLRKGLDRVQVGQLEGQDGQAVPGAVVLELIVGGLRALRVAGAEDELVGLGLGEQLLDQLEALLGGEGEKMKSMSRCC